MLYIVISGEKRELDPPETWFCLPHLGKGLRLDNAELQEKREALRRVGPAWVLWLPTWTSGMSAPLQAGFFSLDATPHPPHFSSLHTRLRFSPTLRKLSPLSSRLEEEKVSMVTPPRFLEHQQFYLSSDLPKLEKQKIQWFFILETVQALMRSFRWIPGVPSTYLHLHSPEPASWFPRSRDLWAQEGTWLYLSSFFWPQSSHPLDAIHAEDMYWAAIRTVPALAELTIQRAMNVVDGCTVRGVSAGRVQQQKSRSETQGLTEGYRSHKHTGPVPCEGKAGV